MMDQESEIKKYFEGKIEVETTEDANIIRHPANCGIEIIPYGDGRITVIFSLIRKKDNVLEKKVLSFLKAGPLDFRAENR